MITKEEAYKKIEQLVIRFDEQKDAYRNANYNEMRTRNEFINPFFKALGWDIDNENAVLESYRDVILEAKVKVKEGSNKATKTPDFLFRLSEKKNLFFVEAKKPSVVIKDDVAPAYQLRRYGWSAKLAVSILTDFEEFAIYDCTKKPNLNDKASIARLKYITYLDYLKEFDFIWNTFSKESVLEGRFDKFIKNDTFKKGSTTVDISFLESLDSWRTLLATSISINNKQINEDQLNLAVQQAIDRIIFLRIAEDRGVEPYANLKTVLRSTNYYKNLFNIYKEADDKYNSGLFDFNKDKISKTLTVDNKVIKTIIDELYYPVSPYEFSVLSVEILGTAYEQFLGKQITIDKNHKARIEEKPAVRKAGGVYYTPQYIVDYIIENTIGNLIEGKTPKDIEKLKIVDPSCGSGSFLLGAYQYLLDWHKDYYTNKGRSLKTNKNNTLTPEGNLTTAEKKRIILNNIFGVDIDANAVEVTKLSLLLKCMEGETHASIATQKALFNDRVLPTLDNNVKNGNSIIDLDYHDEEFDFGYEKSINAFSWQNQFKEVFKQGGFDAVIGNPPWVSLNGKFGNDILNPQAQQYLIKKYNGNTYRPNLYEYFVHKGLEIINDNGVFSFIVPDRLGFNNQFISLRKKILTKYKITNLLYKAPFPGITTDTLVFCFANKKAAEKSYKIQVGEFGKKLQTKSSNDYLKDNEHQFIYESNNAAQKTLVKIFEHNKCKPLGEVIESKTGVILDTTQVTKTRKNKKQIEIAKGRCIGKFNFLENYYCEFSSNTIKGGTNDISKLGAKEKVLLRKTGFPIIATYNDTAVYPEQSLYFLINNKTKNSLKYFTALINSKLFQFVYINKLVTNKDSTPQLKKIDLDKFPVFVCNLKNKGETQKHDDIVKQVNLLLKFNVELQTTTVQTKIDYIHARVQHSEELINKTVYDLYNMDTVDIETIEKYDQR